MAMLLFRVAITNFLGQIRSSISTKMLCSTNFKGLHNGTWFSYKC